MDDNIVTENILGTVYTPETQDRHMDIKYLYHHQQFFQ